MKSILTAFLCALVLSIPAADARGARGGYAASDPLTLPLATSSNTTFTFLGSFQAPTNISYGGGALSVTGSDLYMSSEYGGMAEITIPALSGTPDTTGGNAPAACNTSTCSGSALLAGPVTVSSTGFWNSSCESANIGLTGSLVYNGTLLVTAGPVYDASTCALAFVTGGSLSALGTPNSASVTGGTYQRFWAGALGILPTLWRPYFGGTCFVGSGNSTNGGLSIASASPAGFDFGTFHCGAYASAGAAIPLTEYINYTGSTLGVVPDPESLEYRSFSGPFPTTGSNSMSYTLTAAPQNGNTTATLTTPFVNTISSNEQGPFQVTFSDGETRVVHLAANWSSTASVTSGSTTLTVSGFSGGYHTDIAVGDTINGAGIPASTTIASGSGTTGTYTMSAAATATSPSGGELVWSGYAGVPDGLYTCSYGVTGCQSFPALTSCPSGGCSTAVTISPMGDNYYSQYDGNFGTEFIVPNTRSLIYITVHSYGPHGLGGEFGGNACQSGSSGANDNPIPPDTLHYQRLQISAYDLAAVYDAHVNSQPVYSITPYAWWNFPGWQANWGGTTNCVQIPTGGFYFDPTHNILYGVFSSATYGSGNMIVNEWQVSGP